MIGRRARRWAAGAVAAVALVVAGLGPMPTSRAAATPAPSGVRGDGAPRYRPPVDAPVADPFRPPAHDWEPGNRGLEYATIPGTVVRAVGPGRVEFAGPVAGARYVTVRHPDGLRSSYAYLDAISVTVGDPVAGGDPVGVAGTRFHVGIRRGRTYLDPAALWGTRVGGGRVRLIPGPGSGPPPRSGPGSGRPSGRLRAGAADLAAAVAGRDHPPP